MIIGDPLQRRQAANGSFNMATWEADTMKACKTALSGLSVTNNPSGMAVCYNLPQLDTNDGTFMADMRLFQVSTPSGDFSGIPPQNINGGVQYTGASASLVSQQTNGKRDDLDDLDKRQTLTVTPEMPNMLRSYMFVGQINPEQMNQPMTLGVLEPLVMPIVTLSAKNTAGQTISTNVSSNEATFVNGIFSTEVVLSDTAKASLAVQNVTDFLNNGTIAFIVPGVNLLIFPVGLVVTGFWALAGFVIYGFGTFERYGHAESYRRRKALSGKGNMARI
ncbi:hypothetical protein F4780DRAFT_660662 [Xylariomycetidae sp. FL0641]|nr:hypothetical protein F4780DRAFT_660662 [Xylariomycetidae sp. FL0641]